jgi:hypothetical protein
MGKGFVVVGFRSSIAVRDTGAFSCRRTARVSETKCDGSCWRAKHESVTQWGIANTKGGWIAAIAAGVVYDDDQAGQRINPRIGVHE